MLCRLTLANEFCNDRLYIEAAKKPHFLPALLLGDARKHVLQTRGAMTYASEITCLVKTSKANLDSFLSVELPVGAFLAQHRTETVPQWIPREKDVTSASCDANARGPPCLAIAAKSATLA